MTGSDVAAIVTATGGAVGAVATAIALLRKRSGELAAAEEMEAEHQAAWKRAALRIIRSLREILAEHGIPEPEGIDDELRLGRRRDADADA